MFRKRINVKRCFKLSHPILDFIVYSYFVVAADCEASAVNQLDTKILPICKLIINMEILENGFIYLCQLNVSRKICFKYESTVIYFEKKNNKTKPPKSQVLHLESCCLIWA